MMEMHDYLGTGYQGPFTAGMWPYNELLFDTWTQPWEPDLAKMVEAVFVPERGSERVKEHARRAHHTLLQHLGKSTEEIPLVEYDPSVEADAYRALAYRCEGDVCHWLD